MVWGVLVGVSLDDGEGRGLGGWGMDSGSGAGMTDDFGRADSRLMVRGLL